MTRLADDYAKIRARYDELARDLSQEPRCSDPKGCEHPGLCRNPCRIPQPQDVDVDAFDADLELLTAIFGRDAGKIAAHAEALGPSDIMFVRCPGIELVRQPDLRWRGTVDGHPIGPYDKLPTALGVACSLRDKLSR